MLSVCTIDCKKTLLIICKSATDNSISCKQVSSISCGQEKLALSVSNVGSKSIPDCGISNIAIITTDTNSPMIPFFLIFASLIAS